MAETSSAAVRLSVGLLRICKASTLAACKAANGQLCSRCRISIGQYQQPSGERMPEGKQEEGESTSSPSDMCWKMESKKVWSSRNVCRRISVSSSHLPSLSCLASLMDFACPPWALTKPRILFRMKAILCSSLVIRLFSIPANSSSPAVSLALYLRGASYCQLLTERPRIPRPGRTGSAANGLLPFRLASVLLGTAAIFTPAPKRAMRRTGRGGGARETAQAEREMHRLCPMACD